MNDGDGSHFDGSFQGLGEDSSSFFRDTDQETERARSIALASLNSAPRTRHQLEQKLSTRKVDEEVARAVLDRLTEVGLIDDESYARAWVSSRQRKAISRYAIKLELQRKGIAVDIIDSVLAEVDGQDEIDAAGIFVERKAFSLRRLPPDVLKRRLTGMLCRKGYPPGVAYDIVRRVLDDMDLPASDHLD